MANSVNAKVLGYKLSNGHPLGVVCFPNSVPNTNGPLAFSVLKTNEDKYLLTRLRSANESTANIPGHQGLVVEWNGANNVNVTDSGVKLNPAVQENKTFTANDLTTPVNFGGLEPGASVVVSDAKNSFSQVWENLLRRFQVWTNPGGIASWVWLLFLGLVLLFIIVWLILCRQY